MINSAQLDWISHLQHLEGVDDIKKALTEKLAEYGYTQFIYGVMPIRKEQTPVDYIELNTLDRGWMETYEKENFANDDFVLRHAINNNEVLLWSDVDRFIANEKLTQQMSEVVHARKDFGLHSGITIPIGCHGSYRACVSVVADKDADAADFDNHFRSHSGDIKTVLEVFHAFADLKAIARQRYGLTDKEIEVLRWLSDGLQVKQIASRTGRSESTLEKQILSAKRRLNAATTVQAVTKAALLKLLH